MRRMDEAPIRIWSGNIRGWAPPEMDGGNAWVYRAQTYANLLRTRQPHLVGLQEFIESNKAYLSTALPNHEWNLGPVLGGFGDAYTPLAWDTNRFRVLNQGGDWLNEYKNVKAKGWNAQDERAFTWVELEDLAVKKGREQRRLLFINTHLDHKGEEARVGGTQKILDFVGEQPVDMPIIITGDFNSGPFNPRPEPHYYTAESYKLFAAAGFMDIWRTANGIWPPPATFHNYKGSAYRVDKYGTWYIDWPLARNLKVVSAEIVKFKRGEKPPSDHYPVTAEVAHIL